MSDIRFLKVSKALSERWDQAFRFCFRRFGGTVNEGRAGVDYFKRQFT